MTKVTKKNKEKKVKIYVVLNIAEKNLLHSLMWDKPKNKLKLEKQYGVRILPATITYHV